MIIVTTLNSTYEVDVDAERIRRVEGEVNPTPRFGDDGKWRTYSRIIDLGVGKSMVIEWPPGGDEDRPGMEFKTHTVSSTVLGISR